MHFEIVGEVTDATTIAAGPSVQQRLDCKRFMARDVGEKRKGFAQVKLATSVRKAEIHWYEATGIGRREYKIKRFID